MSLFRSLTFARRSFSAAAQRVNTTRTATNGASSEVLSASQLAQFDRDGFLVLPNMVPVEWCNKLKTRANQLVQEFEPKSISVFSTKNQVKTSDEYFLQSKDKISFFFEEDAFNADGSLKQSKELSINKLGHAMHDVDPTFMAFSYQPNFIGIMKSLGYVRPQLLQSMYIFKQPKIGGQVDPHQDNTFLWTNPFSCRGIWVAVEDAAINNGCLYAIPGSHKHGTRSRFIRNADNQSTQFVPGRDTYDLTGAVPLEAKAGTVVLLNGGVVHYSDHNLSNKSRHAYTLHIIETHNTEYPKDNWLVRDDFNEMYNLSPEFKAKMAQGGLN